MRWHWKTVPAFPWRQSAHINELELSTCGLFEEAISNLRQASQQVFPGVGLNGVPRMRSKRSEQFPTAQSGAEEMDTCSRCGPSVPGTSLTNQVGCMKPKRSLRYIGLRPRTLRAYRTAIDRFLKFVNRKRLGIARPHQLDRQLAEFIDISYQEGDPLSYAGHLLSAMKRFHPQLRLELPESSQFLRNWQRCYVPQRANPASWPLVEEHMALLLGLGFCCLLRASEMLAVTHHHLVFHTRQRGLSVILPESKMSQRNPQVLLVEDPPLIQMAKAICRPKSTQLRLTIPPTPFAVEELPGGFNRPFPLTWWWQKDAGPALALQNCMWMRVPCS